MTIKNPTIPGEVLAGLNRKVNDLEEFLAHVDDMKPKVGMYHGSGPKILWDGLREQAVGKLQTLKDERRRHMSDNPPPPRSALVCPHCSYDGEFEAEKGKTTGCGFRMLQPVLEPRWIVDYDGAMMTLSDTCDRHDPFDMIAEPGYVDCLDKEPGKDETEAELRRLLKGRWVICCGNEDCLKYFDARPFIEMAHLEYGGYDHPNLNKWGER